MQITGMLYGSKLPSHVGFAATEVLGSEAGEDQIRDLIRRHGLIFVKPLFRGGVGKKGKAGLIGKATDLRTALAEKERLYFADHRHGNVHAKANGVTFEAGVPAEHEVYEITGSWEGAVGRSRWDAPEVDGCVFIDDEDETKLQQGDIARVAIDKAGETDLWGKLVD